MLFLDSLATRYNSRDSSFNSIQRLIDVMRNAALGEESESVFAPRPKKVKRLKGSATITNGFPESGGGGASATESACTEATGTDAAPEASSDDDDGGDGDGDPDGWRPSHSSSPHSARRATRQSTGATLSPEKADCELWRLATVLKHVPVSRTGWLTGVKAGRYPPPIKLSPRVIVWRASDIRALVASL